MNRLGANAETPPSFSRRTSARMRIRAPRRSGLVLETNGPESNSSRSTCEQRSSHRPPLVAHRTNDDVDATDAEHDPRTGSTGVRPERKSVRDVLASLHAPRLEEGKLPSRPLAAEYPTSETRRWGQAEQVGRSVRRCGNSRPVADSDRAGAVRRVRPRRSEPRVAMLTSRRRIETFQSLSTVGRNRAGLTLFTSNYNDIGTPGDYTPESREIADSNASQPVTRRIRMVSHSAERYIGNGEPKGISTNRVFSICMPGGLLSKVASALVGTGSTADDDACRGVEAKEAEDGD